MTVLRAEAALERAGLARRRPVQPPAIAFLDLTGYTKLTEERGDQARGRAGRLAGRDRPRARPPLPHAPAALFADKCTAGLAVVGQDQTGWVRRRDLLGGLVHEYHRAA